MSIFEQLQSQVVAQLLAQPFFSDVPVLAVHEKEIESMIDQAIAEIGIVVLVAVISAKVQNPNMSVPYYEATFLIQVSENVTVNTLSKNAIEICENLMLPASAGGLTGWSVPSFCEESYCAENAFDLLPTPIDKNRIYECRFKTHLGITQAPLATVNDPILTNVAGTLTISGTTPGAGTFYTTNGSYPNPIGGTVYTVPFAVTPGQTVKARSWLMSRNPSHLVSLAIT